MINKDIRSAEISKIATRKKIAFIFNHPFFLGGGEISLFELIKNLDRTRFEPIVIIPKAGQVKNKLRVNNIEVYISPLPSIKSILNGLPFVALINLLKFVRNSNVELIHANGSRACLYGGLAGRILGIPVIWHVRETIKDLVIYDGLLCFLAKAIICVSKNVCKKRFERFGKWIQKKIFVIYNGVDTYRFNKKPALRKIARKKLGLENEILFGIIGNIIPLKQQDFLIKGFAKAKEKKPGISAKVLIIGRMLDLEFNQILHKLVMDLNLDRDVIFKNYSENIIEVFAALDVFVLLSKREGFSRSLIEAMSMGLPVLATKIGEIEEAVFNGENAILVNFNDIENLATAIIQLYENRKLRENLGAKNRKRVEEKFDLISHSKAMANIYDKILT